MQPMNYVEPPDVPEGLTLREWHVALWRERQQQAGAGGRSSRLRRWLRGLAGIVTL
jgi:hypothetical protein